MGKKKGRNEKATALPIVVFRHAVPATGHDAFAMRSTLLKFVGYSLIASPVLVIGGFAAAYWHSKSQCVQLPNGLLIGPEALLDPAKAYWSPTIVLKQSNGRTLLPHWVETFYFTRSTTFGTTLNNALSMGQDQRSPFRDIAFAYRSDTGLVIKHKDPELYRKLREEAGDVLWVEGNEQNPVHTNILYDYGKLLEDPAYGPHFCPLGLFPMPGRWYRH